MFIIRMRRQSTTYYYCGDKYSPNIDDCTLYKERATRFYDDEYSHALEIVWFLIDHYDGAEVIDI